MLAHHQKKYGELFFTSILFFLVNAVFVFCRTPNNIKGSSTAVQVSGTITQTSSYCGGAAPPQRILEQLKTPVAYAGKKIYIKAGDTNDPASKIIASFTSGNDGSFSVSLQPGKYVFLVEEQLQKIDPASLEKQHQRVDKNCLQNWWIKPLYLLEVGDKDLSGLNFNFHHPCFISSDIPCLEYTGPPAP